MNIAMRGKKNYVMVAQIVLTLVLVIFFSSVAEAGSSSGLPWEGAMKTLSDSLTGPVAYALGLLMIVCGFCAVAFTGADMGGWVKWVAGAAILAGMLGMAPKMLEIFGLSSAMIL